MFLLNLGVLHSSDAMMMDVVLPHDRSHSIMNLINYLKPKISIYCLDSILYIHTYIGLELFY